MTSATRRLILVERATSSVHVASTGVWPAVSPSTTSVTRAAAIFSSTISPGGHSHAQVIVPRLVAPRAGRVLADQRAYLDPRPDEVDDRLHLFQHDDVAPSRSPDPERHRADLSCPGRSASWRRSRLSGRPGPGRCPVYPRRALAIFMSSATTKSAPTPRQSHWNTPSAWAQSPIEVVARLALVPAVGEQDGVPYAGLVAQQLGGQPDPRADGRSPAGVETPQCFLGLVAGGRSSRRPAAATAG